MSVTISAENRKGYGQIEVVKVGVGETNQIFAQLKADPDIVEIQNGEFYKYSRALGKVTADPAVEGEWLLSYNEEEVYERTTPYHHETKRDFKLSKELQLFGELYPRLIGTFVGDTYKTNMVADGVYSEGDLLIVKSTQDENSKYSKGAVLTKAEFGSSDGAREDYKGIIYQVGNEKECILADGQAGLLLVRVQ